MKYKNSKKRLLLLLTQAAAICYTLFAGNIEAKLLAFMLVPMWLMAFNTWRKYE